MLHTQSYQQPHEIKKTPVRSDSCHNDTPGSDKGEGRIKETQKNGKLNPTIKCLENSCVWRADKVCASPWEKENSLCSCSIVIGRCSKKLMAEHQLTSSKIPNSWSCSRVRTSDRALSFCRTRQYEDRDHTTFQHTYSLYHHHHNPPPNPCRPRKQVGGTRRRRVTPNQ